MKRKIIFILIGAVFILNGCWDKVELENRGFVNAIGIDKFEENLKIIKTEEEGENKEPAENTEDTENTKKLEAEKDMEDIISFGDEADHKDDNRFMVSMGLPSLEMLSGAKESDTKNKSVKIAANPTIAAAMRLIDAGSSQKLYFGHTKVCVLGEALLKDETLFRETIDALERNREINRKITMLSTQTHALETLKGNIEGEPLLGMFISNFYKHNTATGGMAFRKDLQTLIHELHVDGCGLIPMVTLKDSDIKLSGAALIKDFKLADWLDDKKTRGYLWVKGQAKDAQVLVDMEGQSIPLRVNKNTVRLNFFEENQKLICEANIKINGVIEEFISNGEILSQPERLKHLSALYENAIAEEILYTFSFFQEHRADALGLKNTLRKKYYDLFQQHQENWEQSLFEMQMRPIVHVKIVSSGAIL